MKRIARASCNIHSKFFWGSIVILVCFLVLLIVLGDINPFDVDGDETKENKDEASSMLLEENITHASESDTGEGLLETFESGWTLDPGGSGNYSYDSQIYHQGMSSLKLSKPVGEPYVRVEKRVNLNLTSKLPAIWVRIEEGVTYLYCYVLAPNWSNSYTCNLVIRKSKSLEDTWYQMPLHIAVAESVRGLPDISNVTKLVMETRGDESDAVSSWFDEMSSVPCPEHGKVTLRFDDGDVSTYEHALPIMTRYGFSGVSGIITSYVGIARNGLTLPQLTELQEKGWDIVSHSVFHKLDHDSSAEDVEVELKESQKFLIENGFARGARFYIAPGGKVSATIMQMIQQYYDMASFSWPRMNNIPAYPWVVGGCYVAQGTSPTVIEEWIDEAEEYGLWLVLMFHTLDESGDPYTYSTNDFAEIMAYLDTIGIPVVTFSDMLDANGFALASDDRELVNSLYKGD